MKESILELTNCAQAMTVDTKYNACEECDGKINCILCEKIYLALALMKMQRNKTFLQRHTRKIQTDIAAYEREFENWMFLIKLLSFFLVLTQVILILF